MAVSAEISATVISTRAKSSMRKNCRIVENYSVSDGRVPAFLERCRFPWPHIAAAAASASSRLEHICEVKRLAPGALRLLEASDAINIQYLGRRLVQDFLGRFRILRVDLQFDSAEKVRDKPIHADHVVVHQVSPNAGRLQTALCQQRFREIAELSQ